MKTYALAVADGSFFKTMKEGIKIKGKIKFEIRDENGKVKDKWTVYNSVMNLGFAELANLAGNVSSPAYFTYLALGTDATAVAPTQTALVAEITDTGLARHSATVSRVTTTQTNDTLQLAYTWTASGAKTINEIGIFNNSSTGIMLARALTGAKVLGNLYTFSCTYQVKFS